MLVDTIPDRPSDSQRSGTAVMPDRCRARWTPGVLLSCPLSTRQWAQHHLPKPRSESTRRRSSDLQSSARVSAASRGWSACRSRFPVQRATRRRRPDTYVLRLSNSPCVESVALRHDGAIASLHRPTRHSYRRTIAMTTQNISAQAGPLRALALVRAHRRIVFRALALAFVLTALLPNAHSGSTRETDLGRAQRDSSRSPGCRRHLFVHRTAPRAPHAFGCR